MRILLIVILVAFISLPALACKEFDDAMEALEAPTLAPAAGQTQVQHAMFAEEFPGKQDLVQWTENSTSGGGHVEEIEFAGKKLMLSFRGYTSGVKSSDAAIYVMDDGKWKLAKTIAPIWNAWIKAETNGQQLVLFRDDTRETLLVVMPSDLRT